MNETGMNKRGNENQSNLNRLLDNLDVELSGDEDYFSSQQYLASERDMDTATIISQAIIETEAKGFSVAR